MLEARCDCFKNKAGCLGGKLEWGLKAERSASGVGTGTVNNGLMLSMSFFVSVLFRLA